MALSSEQPSAEKLSQLAAQLSQLGAESRAERTAKQWLPWIISIAIHLGVLTVAVFITWTVTNRPKEDESIVVVADFNAMLYDPVVASSTVEQNPTDVAPTTSVPIITPTVPTADVLMNQLRDSDARHRLLSSPIGDSGAAALAGLAPTIDGTAASFAGTSATNARRIVYLIDATGSMIAHLQIVVDELARSLSNLSSQQSYTVVFFQGDSAIEVPPGGRLIPASRDENQRVIAWIKSNVVPKDRTNPLPAIELAIRRKPDVIFLLSHGLTGHGEFEIDQRDLLARLDALNPADASSGRRPTQINCIQFIAVDPLDTMQRIAQTHGGPNGYKFLSRRELGLSEQ